MKKKSLVGLLGKPPKACVGWWGYRLATYRLGANSLWRFPQSSPGPTSVLTPASTCKPKGHQQNQNVWEQMPAEIVTTAAAALNSILKKMNTKKINGLVFGLIITMDFLIFSLSV